MSSEAPVPGPEEYQSLPSIVEEALYLAGLANVAHTEMAMAKSEVNDLDALRGRQGVTIDETFYAEQKTEASNAEVSWIAYTAMAGVVLAQPVPRPSKKTKPAVEPKGPPTAQPEQQRQPKKAAVAAAKEKSIDGLGAEELRALLFDTVVIDGKERDFVSPHSLRRYARTQGQTPQQTGSYWKLFDSFAQLSLDNPLSTVTGLKEAAIVDKRGIAFLGEFKSNAPGAKPRPVWGFSPTLFEDMVNDIVKSPELQAKAKGYSEASQTTLTSYIKALNLSGNLRTLAKEN